MNRRDFLGGFAACAAAGVAPSVLASAPSEPADELDLYQAETDLVKPEDYRRYEETGDTAGFKALEKLERAFDRVLAEVKTTKVTGDVPAVWLVYNMGFIVKTRESCFSIDLRHRRAPELAPLLDFALITHNHGDHYTEEFYRSMDRFPGGGKTVVSNFKDNYGAAPWKQGGVYWKRGGYTRAEKVFELKDVKVRTTLHDHNGYLIDFVTGFEIKIGDFILYHTGDCGNARSLKPLLWGRPDLWLFFPGCGINPATAQKLIRPKRMAFGHLWELGHSAGRLTTSMVRASRRKVEGAGGSVTVPLWGERVI